MLRKVNFFLRFFITLLVMLPLVTSRAQWEEVNPLTTTFNGGTLAIDACDENTAVVSVCGTTPAVCLTKDGGSTWDRLSLPEQKIMWDISMVDSNHIWMCSENKIFATFNGGENWTVQYDGAGTTDWFNYIEMFDASNGFAQGDVLPHGPTLILKTTDGGENWISMNNSEFGYGSGDLWRRLDFVNPDVGYFFVNDSGASGKLMKTTNGGQAWSQLDFQGSMIWRVKFYNEEIGLFATWSHMLRTLDGGATIDTVSELIDSQVLGLDIEFAPEDPSKVWFSTNSNDRQLYFSSDTGRTWIPQLEDNCMDIVFTDSLHGWTFGYNKIYRTTTGGVNTEVSEYVNRTGPEKFSLQQNFPNPFNNETVIQFDLNKKEYVSLTVYDLLGKVITTIAEGYYQPGRYTVKFNGDGLPSGIYFYRLQSQGFTDVKKMVLVE